jgi:hypothetical protein
MAYITAEDVKAIRNELKARYPKFKFGCKKGAGSLSVDVTIKQGPVDFIENYLTGATPGTNVDYIRKSGSLQVNPYWLDSTYSGEALTILEDIVTIVKTAPARGWYDRSDAMTDYFDTAYYFHISIGEWNKPYQVA